MSASIRAALDAHDSSSRRSPTYLMPSRSIADAKALAVRVGLLFGISAKELFGLSRHRLVTGPRFYAMWAVREAIDLSYPEIGRVFGGRDHATVISACRRAKMIFAENPETEKAVRECADLLVTAEAEAA
jgi:chromosomal replication initiation ATPase DnaA